MVRSGPQTVLVEQLGRAPRHGRRGVDDGHVAPGDNPLEDGHQKGIVRTAEDNLVGTALQHPGHRPTHTLLGLGRRFAVGLHQLDEALAGGVHHLDAAAVAGRRTPEELAVEAPLGGQHPHHPAARMQAGGFDGRLHAHERDVGIALAQEVNGCGRGRIAGDDHQLAPLRNEVVDRLAGQTEHLLARPRPIGAVLAVAQIEERLPGQRTPQLAPHGQASEARIIYSDRTVVHSNQTSV